MADGRHEPVRAGGLDWTQHWRRLVEYRRERIESLMGDAPGPGYWDRRAGWFVRLNRQVQPATDPLVQMLAGALEGGGTLLDVGAGTGRYALPLARLASRVTAVEPSEGMRAHLEQEARGQGIDNVSVIGSGWEAAEVEPHDVVLCSHVLYPIADIVPFLEKLDAHARRACYITMRVAQMAPDIGPLWHQVWGVDRPPEPGVLDLINVAYSTGLRANLRLVPFTGPGPYEDLDDAVERVRQLIFLPPGPDERDPLVRRFVQATLVRRDGGLDWPTTQQAGVVWWENGA